MSSGRSRESVFRRQMKNFLLISMSLVGLGVFVVGAILPTRLPRNQRNLGMEAIYSVAGFALGLAPVVLIRRKKR